MYYSWITNVGLGGEVTLSTYWVKVGVFYYSFSTPISQGLYEIHKEIARWLGFSTYPQA